MNIEIAAMTKEHWPAVRDIFGQGIATGNATFGTKVPGWEEWDARHLPTCRLVAVHDDKIVGWAALSAVSSREVYRGVAEVSVYIEEGARGQGVGAALLAKLIDESERNGIWTCRLGFSPRTPPAFVFTKKLASALWAGVSASAARAASGATRC